MNRIILIGNGFDLAHGLKTSYADFINWYWDDWGKWLLHGMNRIEQDPLCSFQLRDEINLHSWAYVWGYHYQRTNPLLPWDIHEVLDIAKQDTDLCNFSITSGFFSDVCQDVENKGWVDIENVYYSYLRAGVIEPRIINDELDYLRNRLVEYLSVVQNGVTEDLIVDKRKDKLTEPFREKDVSVEALSNSDLKMQFVNLKRRKMSFVPGKILMLNFNYTNLADLYLPKTSNHHVNHIHGELANPNSVVFGYGDELDVNYKSIVNKNDNEYLRNIKSIRYQETPNYRNLLEFIESSPYQIYIMGHSCGNSDRTLLNTLFEHKNCFSIKPFYFKRSDGSDNYLELVQNISRNFTDMKLMRDRVVNKTFCETL